MTQAHKTIGALVELHDDVFDLEGYKDYYTHLVHLRGVVFEVQNCDGAHTHVIDRNSGVEFGLHSENFKTISKEKKKAYDKAQRFVNKML
ncbi:hypothetical protein NVP2275O_322 [Vibrio phage 2.275.O._10N.286.54.E11]|nr:hypothetical protein NVP2275O_322 [Vibrio phage 2.275.O._10N.286.54.E11]